MLDSQSLEEFMKQINSVTLAFHKPKYEKIYLERRNDPARLTWQVKTVVIIFIIVYAIRRCVTLTEAMLCGEVCASDISTESVMMGCFLLSLVAELIMIVLPCCNKARGLFITLFFCATDNYLGSKLTILTNSLIFV